MGRTPTALRLIVWVDDDWLDHPSILELIEKGHRVGSITSLQSIASEFGEVYPPDLIISRAAHGWHDTMWKSPAYLDMALKAARARKKTRKEPAE